MRYLGALLLLPLLGLGAEEVAIEAETSAKLSAEEFDACLEAQQNHLKVFSEQAAAISQLSLERSEISREHQQHWDEVNPKLIGIGSAAMNPNTDQEFLIRTKLNTVRAAYLAAMNLLQWKNSELGDRAEINIEIEDAWQAIVHAGNQALQDCSPVLEFVAAGLDGTTGQPEPKAN